MAERLRGRVAVVTAAFEVRSAGMVPAEVAGMRLRLAQMAAASGERAELPVHTNTTRSACNTRPVPVPTAV